MSAMADRLAGMSAASQATGHVSAPVVSADVESGTLAAAPPEPARDAPPGHRHTHDQSRTLLEPGHARRLGRVLPWALLAIVVLVALAGPWLAVQDPYQQDLLARNLGPSAAHWLGTDSFGRDVLARIVAGTRLTLIVAIGSAGIALLGGAGLGAVSCLAGGFVRGIVYTAFDMIRTLPAILLSLALMVALGVGTSSVILAVGIAFMPQFGYVTRAVYEREMACGYVTAAQVLGISPVVIAWRHVLPNVVGALLTQLAIIVPRAIVTESVLSFFGLGVSPDVPTWGRIIAGAVNYVEQSPGSLLFPVITLALTTLSLSVVGNRLRDRFDPLSTRN